MEYHSNKFMAMSNVELWEWAGGLERRAKKEMAEKPPVYLAAREIRYLLPVLMLRLEALDPKVDAYVKAARARNEKSARS